MDINSRLTMLAECGILSQTNDKIFKKRFTAGNAKKLFHCPFNVTLVDLRCNNKCSEKIQLPSGELDP